MDKQIKLIYNKKKDKKRELLNIKFTKNLNCSYHFCLYLIRNKYLR